MADAPKLQGSEKLGESYYKINMGIDNANEALKKSFKVESISSNAINIANDAANTASKAEGKADNTQKQLDTIVLKGDSSVEAAQARVDAAGIEHKNLKARIDYESVKIEDLKDITAVKQIQNYAKLLKKVSDNASIKFVCQGDSLTYGRDVESSDKRPPNSDPTLDSEAIYGGDTQASKTYPEAMQEYLSSVYSGVVQVVNHGYSGDYAELSWNRWDKNPYADLVILMLGTNDSRTDTGIPANVRGNIEKFVLDMDNIIKRHLYWGAAVILLAPPNTKGDYNYLRESYRKALQVLADKYSIPLINANEFTNDFPANDVYSADNLHYNGNGYTVFGSKMAGIVLGIKNIYNPLMVTAGDYIVPDMSTYGFYAKTTHLTPHSGSVFGIGNTANEGKMYWIAPGDKLNISFVTTNDDMLLIPLLKLNSSTIRLQLDFGKVSNIPSAAVTAGVATKASVPKQNFANDITLTGSTDYRNASTYNLENAFLISKAGHHSIQVEGLGAGQTALCGFLLIQSTKLMKYNVQFQNGWKEADGVNITKDDAGNVVICGSIKRDDATLNLGNIFVLPETYRPKLPLRFRGLGGGFKDIAFFIGTDGSFKVNNYMSTGTDNVTYIAFYYTFNVN